jgi:multicomponent Na+:H+ antiporter subunit E
MNVFKKEFVPVVFKISLDHLDPVRVAIVANSITLTPGTISIEIVNQSIYVMVLAKPNTPLAVLEKPIREKFEKLLDTEINS